MGQWKRYAWESRKDAGLKQCEDDIIEMSENVNISENKQHVQLPIKQIVR